MSWTLSAQSYVLRISVPHSLNRVTSASYPTDVATTFEYDGGATPVANSIGQLSRITDESGSTSYTHDAFGRVVNKTQVVGSGAGARTFVVGYEWGASGAASGKLVAITYPSGSRVNLGYDMGGRLASLSVNPVAVGGGGPNGRRRLG
jgi:YD repeat-containing protein